MSVLPIKTKIRGPSPIGQYAYPSSSCIGHFILAFVSADPSAPDILDETMDLFRANSLFRNFEIKGPADRLLIVNILFISECLAKIGTSRTVPSQLEATKSLNTLAVDNFPLPGDATFPLNSHYATPGNRADAGEYNAQHLVRGEGLIENVQTTFANI